MQQTLASMLEYWDRADDQLNQCGERSQPYVPSFLYREKSIGLE